MRLQEESCTLHGNGRVSITETYFIAAHDSPIGAMFAADKVMRVEITYKNGDTRTFTRVIEEYKNG